MTITAIAHWTCRECGRPIKDGTSKLFRTGPCCRKGMSPDQLLQAMELTRAESQPGRIPAQRAASVAARHTNAVARQTVEAAVRPDRCEHDGIAELCPMCRRDAAPTLASTRILTSIRQQTFGERREQLLAVSARRFGRLL